MIIRTSVIRFMSIGEVGLFIERIWILNIDINQVFINRVLANLNGYHYFKIIVNHIYIRF